jgi:hypothetical protein
MRSNNKSRLELYVESYLRMHPRVYVLGINYYRKALAYIQELYDNDCCDENSPVIDLYTRLDNDFTRTVYQLTRTMSRTGNIKSLERTINLLENYINRACCPVSTLTTNQPVIDQTLLRGYASTGNTATFTFTPVSTLCAPFTVKISTDFGYGPVVAETFTATDSTPITRSFLSWIVGKNVNYTGIIQTVVSNVTTPVGAQIQQQRLNGTTPTITIDVVDCVGLPSSYNIVVDVEMKRRTKTIAYVRQKDNTTCQCAESIGVLYSDRRGGPNYRSNNTPVLGTTIPTFQINGTNVFNNLFSGGANAKWAYKDVYNTLAGFTTSVNTARTPVWKVFDALITAGAAGSQVNCVFGFLAMELDIRDNDSFVFLPGVHFGNAGCVATPAFGGAFLYNVSADEYPANIAIGQNINVGSGTAGTIQQVTTPTALAW